MGRAGEASMATRWLFIIDVQKGFINRWTEAVPARVEALQGDFDRVVATRFFNPPGSLHRRLIGWHRFDRDSDDFGFAFAPRADAQVLDKATYTCLTPDLLGTLRGDGVETVHLAGIATDNCVLKTAVDLFEAGIAPLVHADACASHGGPDCHAAGLMLLRRFIGEAQVVGG
jgi:nicotinamidase-related amidase